MLLEIDDWRSVSDLQYRFNKCFPLLQLEVFDNKRRAPKQQQRPQDGTTLLSSLRYNHHSGVLSIKSWYKKAEVEAMLREQYGLQATIYRLCGEKKLNDPEDASLTLQQLTELAERQQEPMQMSNAGSEELDGW